MSLRISQERMKEKKVRRCSCVDRNMREGGGKKELTKMSEGRETARCQK